MSHAENQRAGDCVPVSKPGTPVAATVLPVSKPATTRGGRRRRREVPELLGAPQGETLRQRADRALWELEATAELMAAGLPPTSGPARLVAARLAAARALLLEVLGELDPSGLPVVTRGSAAEPCGELALVGALCRRHGWRTVRPGVLARVGRQDRG